MNMNPWLAERLVADRRDEVARAAEAHRRLEPADEASPGARSRSHPALARRVGVLLIAVGRRLADGDAVPAHS